MIEFKKAKRYKSGVEARCKLCANTANRKWQKLNPRVSVESCRKYRASNLERERARSREWHAAHKDDLKGKVREWQKANAEKVRQAVRKWQRAHPEKTLAVKHNRRARLLGNGGKVTAKEWKALKEFYGYTCLRCERKEPDIKLTLDHVIPIISGGQNVISNAQPLCGSCNSAKGTKTIDYRR